jgi:hypothetical protein
MFVVSALALLHERIGALESGMSVWGAIDYVRDREGGVVDRGAERELRVQNGAIAAFYDDMRQFTRRMRLLRELGGLQLVLPFPRIVEQIKIYLVSNVSTHEAGIVLQYNFRSEPYMYVTSLGLDGLMTGGIFHEMKRADYEAAAANGDNIDNFVHFRIVEFEDRSRFTPNSTFTDDDEKYGKSLDYADRGDGSKFQTAYQLVYTDTPRVPTPGQRRFDPPPSEQIRRRFYIYEAKQMRFFYYLFEKLVLRANL